MLVGGVLVDLFASLWTVRRANRPSPLPAARVRR
jgi:hypothetical protein